MLNQRFIFDTHCWLWANLRPELLTPQVSQIINNKDNEIMFSVVSAWEISIKYALNKLQLPLEPIA